MTIIASGLRALPGILKGPGGRRDIARGVVGTLGLKISNVALGLVVTVLMARLLGADGYGLYAYVTTLVAVMAIPTQAGLPELVLRYVAQYKAHADWGLLRGLVGRAQQVVIGASAGLLVIAALSAWLLRERFDADSLLAFLVALILLPVLSFEALRLSILRGLGHPMLGQMPEELIRPAVLALALVVIALLPNHEWFNAAPAVALSVAATTVAFCVGVYFLKTRMPRETREAASEYDMKKWVASAIPFMFIGGTYFLNSKIDIIMLGFFRSSAEVGTYAVAVKMAALVGFGITSFAMVLNAQFAHHWAKREIQKVQDFATWAARASFVLILTGSLVFIMGGERLIQIAFGPEFLPGVQPLIVLCLGWIVVAGLGAVDPLLKMTGHESFVARAVGYTTGFNICANLLFIPMFGAVGAAMATTMSLVVRKVMMLYYVRRKLNVDPTILGKPPSAGAVT